MDTSSPIACGIDFGTTNSTVAVMENGKPVALEIDDFGADKRVLKSLLYLNPKGERTIGAEAVERYLWDVKNIESVPPRLVNTGRMIKTFGPSSAGGVGKLILVPEIIEIDESGRGRLLQSLKSVLTSASFPGTTIFERFYSLEELISILLAEIRIRAEKATGKKIDSVVIGRPVRYVGTDQESLALERMAKTAQMAGFKRVEFEFEPVGAALNYGLEVKKNSRVLVFDFGGGTLDVCIIDFPEKMILAVSGRPIGGDLLDSLLIKEKLLKYFGSEVDFGEGKKLPKFLFAAFTNWYQLTLLKSVRTIESLDYFRMRTQDYRPIKNFKNLIINDLGYSLFAETDKAKIRLSQMAETPFEFKSGELRIKELFSREEFEKIIAKELIETEACLEEAISKAGIKTESIDKVLITGGSSKIPVFYQLLANKFGEEKLVMADQFTSVGLGLGIRAGEIFRS